MVKIYATERQFPRIFKFFFLYHAWEALEEVTFLPTPLPHSPYLTPPTKTAKRKKKGGRKLSSVGKWKWNFFFFYFFFFLFIYFGVHSRVSCDDELNSQFLMYEKQKAKEERRRSIKKIQGKTNEINYGYWVVGLNFSEFSVVSKNFHEFVYKTC